MGRFKHLVDSEEGMKSFRIKYNISPHVGVRYAAQGEWFDERKTGEVVIPMIAFIEEGILIALMRSVLQKLDSSIKEIIIDPKNG